jgi:hypothetical protein
VHLWTVSQADRLGWLPLQLGCYAAPAFLLILLRPATWKHAYRFPAPLLLAYLSLPGLQVMVYLATFCWVVRQSWFLDARPADPRIRDLLRLRRQTRTAG